MNERQKKAAPARQVLLKKMTALPGGSPDLTSYSPATNASVETTRCPACPRSYS